MKTIPENLKPTIKEMQRVLQSIQNGKPVFFNITQYTNAGLVKSKKLYTINSAGNKEWYKTKWHLTDKGKQFLNVFI